MFIREDFYSSLTVGYDFILPIILAILTIGYCFSNRSSAVAEYRYGTLVYDVYPADYPVEYPARYTPDLKTNFFFF
jgi:hypothetical protein